MKKVFQFSVYSGVDGFIEGDESLRSLVLEDFLILLLAKFAVIK